jgi:hypothetical protein
MFFGENVKDDKVGKEECLVVFPSVNRFSFFCEEFQSSL